MLAPVLKQRAHEGGFPKQNAFFGHVQFSLSMRVVMSPRCLPMADCSGHCEYRTHVLIRPVCVQFVPPVWGSSRKYQQRLKPPCSSGPDSKGRTTCPENESPYPPPPKKKSSQQNVKIKPTSPDTKDRFSPDDGGLKSSLEKINTL